MKIRQLVFPEKERLEIETIECDESLQPGQVWIRNRASLISAGTELAMFLQLHRGFHVPQATWAEYPFHPGYSVVGEVMAKGTDVSALNIGDLVHHRGKHATHAKVHQGQCIRVPAGCAPETAAFYTLLHHAITALRVAPVVFGQHVVVLGMGLIGNLAAQTYRLAGAGLVAGADPSVKRLELAKTCGAIDLAFNVKDKPLSGWVEQELGEHGAEIIVDAVSTQQALDAAMKAVADRGRVVIVGCPRVPIELDLYFDLHRKGAQLIGANADVVDPEQRRRDRPLLMGLLAAGKLRVAELITQRCAFEDALSAYEGLRDRPDEFVGVVLAYA
ncbi:MAG: zinc-binding alcohol dehydrogenase [Kiritimatiellae bacterium]|nr:zinc-binding alcohol dehydrogenase [Kiritimatiellia bacterium]